MPVLNLYFPLALVPLSGIWLAKRALLCGRVSDVTVTFTTYLQRHRLPRVDGQFKRRATDFSDR
jgi:hypothetical protein